MREALRATFGGRGTHAVPTAPPPPPPDWGRAYRAMADETGIAADVTSGHRMTSGFLDPVLGAALPDEARWDPERGCWETDRPGALADQHAAIR